MRETVLQLHPLPVRMRTTAMTETLHGIQVTHRCAVLKGGQFLCGDPAPYLIDGTAYCAEHALAARQHRYA